VSRAGALLVPALGLALALAGCGGGLPGPPARSRAPGRQAASASSAPPASKAGTPTSSSPSRAGAWLTYHHDGARSGHVAAGPAPGRAGVVWRAPVGAPVQAEPLVAGGLVLVATEDDTVLAFSRSSGALRWRARLGRPVPGSSLPCGNISPSGITGTPVVDPARHVVWVVAFVEPGHHVLFGLRLADGAVVARRRVDPPHASPSVEQQRGALALAHGRVYVPYGGLFGDCGDYHGAVVAAGENGKGELRVFRAPAARQAGIWAPGGVAVAGGDLYATTGNGTPPHGNEVWRLSPTLSPLGYFQPSNAAALDRQDLDLGSTNPLPLPGGLLLQAGKAGVAYLLDARHLGGRGGQLASVAACAGAYGSAARLGDRVYLPCVDGLVSLRVQGSAGGGHLGLAVAWRSPPFSAGPPVVAGHTVWLMDPSAGRLLGLDAVNGTKVASLAVGSAPRFTTPAVAGGQLLVVAGGRLLEVGP